MTLTILKYFIILNTQNTKNKKYLNNVWIYSTFIKLKI